MSVYFVAFDMVPNCGRINQQTNAIRNKIMMQMHMDRCDI